MSSLSNKVLSTKKGIIAMTAASMVTAILSSHTMANGNANAGASKAATCAACHGVDGNSVIPLYPKIAGQHSQYLELALKAYKAQERKGGNAPLMYAMAASLSDQDIADLAAYYAAQTPK